MSLGALWDETTQPGEVVTRFSPSHRKEFRSEAGQEGTGSLLKIKYTLEREVQSALGVESNPGSPDQACLYLPAAGFGNVPLMRPLSLLPFFPYLAPLECHGIRCILGVVVTAV